MGNDSFTKNTNVMTTETAYALSTYTIKLTVNGSNQPVLQVVTRSNETVMSSINLSTTDAEIYTEDTNFYVVGSMPLEDEYVNTVDPSDNDIYLNTSGEIQNINGSDIYLDTYNAYLLNGEGGVSFYQAEKDQMSLRKAS